MPLSRIRCVDAQGADSAAIAEAARAIAAGGVVAFPTRNLYGLGADAFNRAAVEKVFRIKRRPPQKPLLILIGELQALQGLVRRVPPAGARLIDSFWPGGITLVFEAAAELPPVLTAGSGRIGVRLPAHPVAAALAREVRGPITGTSANISGESGCSAVSDMAAAVSERLDLILDAGPLPPGVGSTIVDVTVTPPKILREGSIRGEKIAAALGGRAK